jgi:hypothetical protein
MHDRLSTKSDDVLTSFATAIDWPYEFVYAEACILPLGRYNPLEQVILQIFERFPKQPPSLKEAAERLGIMDPVFIEAILRQMVEKFILGKNNTTDPLDFAGCHINISSLQQENMSPATEMPGMEFCFDAVTSEHIPMPPEELTDSPANPVIEPDKLPARCTHIGLDKARQLIEKQQEQFMCESAGLIELTVLPERGKYLWQILPVTCFAQPDGSLKCQIEQGTELQQQWLDRLDPKHPLFQKLQSKNSDNRISITN